VAVVLPADDATTVMTFVADPVLNDSGSAVPRGATETVRRGLAAVDEDAAGREEGRGAGCETEDGVAAAVVLG
jgi:hypothetical protein